MFFLYFVRAKRQKAQLFYSIRASLPGIHNTVWESTARTFEKEEENCLSRQKEIRKEKKGIFFSFLEQLLLSRFSGCRNTNGRRSHLYNAYLYTLASHLRATQQQQQQPNGFDSAPSPKEFCLFLLLLFDISLRWIISSQVRVPRVQKRFSRSTHVLLAVCVCVYGSGGRAAAAPAVKFSRHPVVSRT